MRERRCATWTAGAHAWRRRPDMENNDKAYDPEPRRLKLDELFGDEPFLSPTMKARRLHEKLQEDQSSGFPTEVVIKKKPLSYGARYADSLSADPALYEAESAYF